MSNEINTQEYSSEIVEGPEAFGIKMAETYILYFSCVKYQELSQLTLYLNQQLFANANKLNNLTPDERNTALQTCGERIRVAEEYLGIKFWPKSEGTNREAELPEAA